MLAVFAAGDVGSLRTDISIAANNGDATNTINLSTGTYSLSGGGGELLIQDFIPATVHSKTLSIVGVGSDQSMIDAP